MLLFYRLYRMPSVVSASGLRNVLLYRSICPPNRGKRLESLNHLLSAQKARNLTGQLQLFKYLWTVLVRIIHRLFFLRKRFPNLYVSVCTDKKYSANCARHSSFCPKLVYQSPEQGIRLQKKISPESTPGRFSLSRNQGAFVVQDIGATRVAITS